MLEKIRRLEHELSLREEARAAVAARYTRITDNVSSVVYPYLQRGDAIPITPRTADRDLAGGALP